MDTSVGRSERTVVFDGEKRGKEGTDPAHIYLDFITVNGVCQSTKDPWSLKVASGSPFWPGAKLLKEFPHSRLIAVNIQLDRLSSWHSIINSGENLLYEIKSHVVKENPHVFLCHGIGGLVAFQAVSLLKSEIWQRLLPLQVAGIVTFGTPIAGVDDTATFCSTLEACAAVESGLEVPSKFDDILQTPVQIEALRQAIVGQYPELPLLSFYEGRESTYKKTLIKRKRMLVSRAIARVGLRNEQALERDSDHGNIARIDDTNFNTLVHWLLKLSHQALQSPEPIQASMTDQSVSSSYSQRRFPESGSELDAEIRNVLHFEQIHTTFPSLNLPCHALWYHQENPYFVGREENLSYLQKVLLPDSSTKQSAFAIWGKGGVGKTQLALKFAFKNRAKYESILWAQADTGDKLLQSFSDYCLDLGLLKQQARDPRTARDTLLRWYATTKVPWLLIFDNADDISVLPGFWPHGTTGSILITSRDPTSATSIAAGQGAELLELSEVDAVIMMEGLLGRKIESKEADLAKSIARKVEYLPLGINSAVGTILETRCSLKDFTAQWDRIQDIIADSDVRRINRPTSRYEFSLNTAWEASLTALNSAARFLMEVLCLLDPDGISDEILKTGSQQLTLLRGSRLLRSTGILLTASLISVISEKDNTRYHIHRLIRGYVYSQMSQEARQNAFDAAMNMILSVWPFPPQHNRTQGSYWMAQEKYLPHVKSMRMIFDDSYEHEVEDGIPPLNPTKDFCRLLNSAAWYCYTRGLYQTSYPLLDAAERCGLAISKSSSQNKQYLVDTWQTRGAIATEAGQFECSREYFTKAGEYLAEMIDSGYVKRPDTREAQIAGGLGNSYHLLGNAKLSLQWYLKSLDLWTAKTAPIYGIILCRCLLDLGRLDEASDRLEAVLEERKQLFGPDDTVDYKTGQALYILGNVRIAQGRLDEAFQIHCRALKQWKATYGPEHRHTAYACHKVALHLERMGKYEDAKSVFKQAIEILESSSEKENNKREIARTLFKLGGLLQNAEGEGLRKRAVQLRAEVLGMQVTDSSPVTERTFEDLVSPWAR